MESLLQVENLTKSYGDRLLFGNITFGVGEGDKIGLIAKNGTGKSTLLKIISGSEPYDSGNIVFHNDIKVGYLEQVPYFDPSLSVMDVCLNSNDEMSEVLKDYEHIINSNNTDAMSAIIQKMDNLDAWDYENRFKQTLSELKITDFDQKISELSGGQLKRVALAKIIINNCDLLILDEPTNHLDIDMIEWLEDYLSRNKVSLLMVTHDRYFLDNVCNKILEIDQESMYSYNGNYDYYLEKRQERIETQTAEATKARNLLRTELDWMRRQPQARGSKAKYRIDAFYALKDKAAYKHQEENVELNVKSSYIGSKIFEAKNISKKYGDKVILDDFNYTFARYEKVGLVGNNGVGKSTFLKMLLGEVAPDKGSFDIGETVNFGYYSQEGMTFNGELKVIDTVKRIAEVITFDEKTRYTASQFLQLFLFSPKDQQKLVSKLSGGEKRRLYLAIVLIGKPNFLILDEPTNDLDITTLGILEQYISKYNGCVIIVSHDRFFMDRTVDHLFVFEGNGKIKDFPGNYSQYREWKSMQEKEKLAQEKEQTKATETVKKKRDYSNKLSFKEKKEFEQLDKEIAELTKEKEELDQKFQSGEQLSDIAELAKRYEEIKELLDTKEMRWLELSEKES